MSLQPKHRSRSPATGLDSAYWDRIALRTDRPLPTARAFLASAKRSVYLGLLERWPGKPEEGWILKTDLFDEARGPTGFLGDLAGRDVHALGMDISFEIARRARAGGRIGRAALVVADVRHLPFKAGAFARVVSPSTLDHFQDPEDLHRSLGGIAMALRPGGDLVITLDNRQNVTDFLLRWANRWDRVPFALGRSCTLRELVAALRGKGFRPENRTAVIHHPRLAAVTTAAVLDRLKRPGLTAFFARVFVKLQRLERCRWRRWTGCFVAVRAVRPPKAWESRSDGAKKPH